MPQIRITKKFSFEMAHALWNYDGPCRNIHGHSYRLSITVSGNPLDNPEHTRYGMVIDFGDLSKLVKETIIDPFDHSLAVSSKAPHHLLHSIGQMFEKYFVTDYQPTCENLVLDIVGRLRKKLPPHLTLQSVKLEETATSSAEWHAGDNA